MKTEKKRAHLLTTDEAEKVRLYWDKNNGMLTIR